MSSVPKTVAEKPGANTAARGTPKLVVGSSPQCRDSALCQLLHGLIAQEAKRGAGRPPRVLLSQAVVAKRICPASTAKMRRSVGGDGTRGVALQIRVQRNKQVRQAESFSPCHLLSSSHRQFHPILAANAWWMPAASQAHIAGGYSLAAVVTQLPSALMPHKVVCLCPLPGHRMSRACSAKPGALATASPVGFCDGAPQAHWSIRTLCTPSALKACASSGNFQMLGQCGGC